jgi:hypothetical protein
VKVRQSHRFTFHPPPPRIHPSRAFAPPFSPVNAHGRRWFLVISRHRPRRRRFLRPLARCPPLHLLRHFTTSPTAMAAAAPPASSSPPPPRAADEDGVDGAVTAAMFPASSYSLLVKKPWRTSPGAAWVAPTVRVARRGAGRRRQLGSARPPADSRRGSDLPRSALLLVYSSSLPLPHSRCRLELDIA